MKQLIPTEKQKLAAYYLDPKRAGVIEVLYGGGAGGGKSFIGSLWLLSMCTTYPGTRWLMGRSKLKTLKETTLNTFFDVLTMMNYPKNMWKYYDSSHIEFKNGSQIVLKDLFSYPSDRDFNSLGSLEITGAFIDEVAQITRRAKEVVRARIRYKLDEYELSPKMLLTCNPTKGWPLYDFYLPSMSGTLRGDKMFIQALLSDNPYAANSYKSTLEGLEDVTLRNRLLYGNWEYENDDNGIIDNDAISDLFTNRFVEDMYTDDTIKYYITADIALHGSDRFVIGIWREMTLEKIISIDKIAGDDVVAKLKELLNRYKVPQVRMVYDSDGIGSYLKGFFPSAVSFVANARATKDNYASLKAQCSYHLAKMINDRAIYIKDRTFKTEIEMELPMIRRKTTIADSKLAVVSKEEIKSVLGHSPDYADMLMMRMYYEIQKASRKKSNFK